MDKKVKQFLSRGWFKWEGALHKERVKEGEYVVSTIYSCMKLF
jgi:hypothetical protein